MNRLLSGRKIVADTKYAERLVDEPTVVDRVTIYAIPTNTSLAHVGNLNVTANAGHENGFVLRHSDRETFHNVNLSDIWVAVKVADEGVTWGAIVER